LQQADDRVTVSTLAFVFPGQGSQSVGMVAELAELHPQVREAFTEASDGAGVDLWALSQGGPEEMLNRTEYTQPALLAASIGVWRAWNAVGGPRRRCWPATAWASTPPWSPPAR
jgi:[acyl-carrier-protein] S-malonyltransferase